MNTLTIQLTDLRFFGYHGVMPQEAQVGNEFRVDLEIEIDPAPLEKSVREGKESLDLTVSYADLFEIIKEEMASRCELLETLAIRITERIFNERPEATTLRIKITKIAPPIPGCNGSAAVTYSRTR